MADGIGPGPGRGGHRWFLGAARWTAAPSWSPGAGLSFRWERAACAAGGSLRHLAQGSGPHWARMVRPAAASVKRPVRAQPGWPRW